MSNKTDIEEDIERLEEMLKKSDANNIKLQKEIETLKNDAYWKGYVDKQNEAIENILVDRERLEEDIKLQEDNYQMLSEDVSNIAKELNLQEDAIIDEIFTAIKILQAKANKYDSLIEKIEDIIIELNYKCSKSSTNDIYRDAIYSKINILQELLDTEKEKSKE